MNGLKCMFDIKKYPLEKQELYKQYFKELRKSILLNEDIISSISLKLDNVDYLYKIKDIVENRIKKIGNEISDILDDCWNSVLVPKKPNPYEKFPKYCKCQMNERFYRDMEIKYVCNNCKKEFFEFKKIKTTYESYYGVASEFPNSTPLELKVCPFCDSDDIEYKKEKY